ncbi:DUF4157 domain-containing protein [Flavivirga aquimarina]|uniref:DUF4157 domain-containing protein n=1 Tax=Flavivirga aquimarina TaxID=2027862 RepID=A0ABT8WDR7_9FLAO|nr:DUF4157 domain-containing protein [Flavivirga aquimarina]MDO5971305.1 DUF4157 domain-containing protein [Flavivirga aquimarina]
MNTYTEKIQENKRKSIINDASKKQADRVSNFQFIDNRTNTIFQQKLKKTTNNSSKTTQLRSFQDMANNSTQVKQTAQLQAMADNNSSQQLTFQNKENNTGLPNNLKTGIENLSGYSMDDVKVHYNSNKPTQLQAHAYAQGTDIHLASGQEKHLPHEAWHVVQQKQGRVKPTMQLKGKVNINNDMALEKEADVMGDKALKANNKLGSKILSLKSYENDSVQLMKNTLVSYGTSDYSADAREWREEEDLGGRNIATICYTVKASGKTFRTSEHSEGKHSEKLLYIFILGTYGPSYKDKLDFHWLYTERETCGADYHDCSSNVPEWFDLDLADIKASVVYPAEDEMSSDSEEEESKSDKAKRRRGRASNIIKRFQTRAKAVAKGDATWDEPYSGGITRPMSPAHYPTDEQYSL